MDKTLLFAFATFLIGVSAGLATPIFEEEVRGYCNAMTEGEFTKRFTQLDDEGMSQAIGYWRDKGWTVESDWSNMTITVRCGSDLSWH